MNQLSIQLKIILAFFLAWAALPMVAIAQEDEGFYSISAPVTGQSLFGLVEILGSATHPTLFESYLLEWSNAQNPDVWLPIQQPVTQQVSNGILGQWDTVGGNIPDGVYQIRLLVFLGDGTSREVQAVNLVLANAAPTSIPTVLPTANAAPFESFGGTPTSLILQPPTATLRPTFESPQSGNTNTDSTQQVSFINYQAIQQAFCNGIFFTMGLFALVIIYLLVRQQLSPYARRLWWQIRSEFKNDRG